MTSLRGKIRLAYLSLSLIVLILCGIAVLDLMFLERQVYAGVAVSDLNDTVLEMRRQEKNLFLYADSTTLSQADGRAGKALDILEAEQTVLVEVSNPVELEALERSLGEYRRLLALWRDNPQDHNNATKSAIRDLGHRISLAVDGFARLERRVLANNVRYSRWWLMITILTVAMLVYLVGRQLSRAVVTPLRHLESRLMPIAEGRFDHIETGSTDQEFVAFTDAFNRMLKELDTRKRRLLQSEKLASLGTLAAGVAHELNNPLSNVSSSCQLLLEELESAQPKQLKTWLHQIDSETERAKRIVFALLEYGRQHETQLQPISLAATIDKSQVLLGRVLRNHDAKLHIDVPADLMVIADPHRLQQVFINLLQNALDACEKGVHIRIVAKACGQPLQPLPYEAEVLGGCQRNRTDNRPVTEILVQDDGPGIAADVLPHVFDPFFTTQEPGRGMGLGLYITQEIVREHDGCIAVFTPPEKGTCIILRLPCQEKSP